MNLPRCLLAAVSLALLVLLASAAECTNPSVRREWRTFSETERTDWLSAVKCLNALPHDDALTPNLPPDVSLIPAVNSSGSYYDDFVYIHMDLNHKIHVTGLFFPWHRWYVAVYETALKEKCGYTGVSPYWYWPKDSPNFKNSDLFKDSSLTSGLGGWGDKSKDTRVQDGAFADFALSYPSYHSAIRRNYTARPFASLDGNWKYPNGTAFTEAIYMFTEKNVSDIISSTPGDFPKMQAAMEGPLGPHGAIHEIMGGDLGGQCPDNAPANCTPGPTWSPNEPLFWMHHAMVDKVWYDWQHADPSNFWAFKGGSVQANDTPEAAAEYPNGTPPWLSLNDSMPADGLFAESTLYDVWNTTGGFLCYVYE